MNRDQIKNPHLIYPGDVVVLDMSSGSPRLRLGKKVGAGTGKLNRPCIASRSSRWFPSIPPNAIEPFISAAAGHRRRRTEYRRQDRRHAGRTACLSVPVTASTLPAFPDACRREVARFPQGQAAARIRAPARSSPTKRSSLAMPAWSSRASQRCARIAGQGRDRPRRSPDPGAGTGNHFLRAASSGAGRFRPACSASTVACAKAAPTLLSH